ncbi:hypothetical protein COY61_00730 [bacterium (Candidatus Gribaldobacteria) CG_4_10_14_0_8_um_filter_33_9]|uniref:Type 4 fimbrial biogenesis protein PilX N-terminal domain-containing protein n=1 Tax=bacterium (Candidatus Gribaldobacteria) CG_4_10_14_0_8_um_filter_33_9 TaxID=2014266 RepID=A0A2M7RNM8_9BACT|nr:MAG: hypothetical protein COY61_00730 [bacterium (Candidatus Gribaldobacteria) CG_4_10_14_0_8_um_filter_33_9]
MKNKAFIIMWVLVFSAVFLIMFSGLVVFFSFQSNQNQRIKAENMAFHIAEAGINYSQWRLAHSSGDFNFSGVYDYKDPEGSIIGQYDLNIASSTACDTGVKIEAKGWKEGRADIQRKIKIKYAKPSLAKYGFLTNSNVWFGEDEELKGPFHSNGGIRMDGEQNSLSTSYKEIYICGEEHDCSIENCSDPCAWTAQGCLCPGIWGIGKGEEKGLWQFPVGIVDFDKIIQNLDTLKTEAQTRGIYLSSSGDYGYHLKFKPNGTFDVYKVKTLYPAVDGYDGQAWTYESNDIKTEAFYQNFIVPSNCAPVFVEDNIWVEGDVKGRTTVVAAKLPEMPASLKKIVISNNINYADFNSVLGLISQKDILIPLRSPNNLEIKAALLAQKGHVFRYYYPKRNYDPYKTYAIRDYIETFGSIITNTIWTFTWVDGLGNVVSGYKETEMSYNKDLTYNPPPYFPVSGDYEVVSWEEVN